MKFHLNNTKENEIDIRREWKTVQNILKSAANESLGTTKRRNGIKYLKIWDDQIKQIIETKKKSYRKWLNSKKLEDSYNTNKTLHWLKRSKKKTKTFLGQICHKFGTMTHTGLNLKCTKF